jgi:hypothetical protein
LCLNLFEQKAQCGERRKVTFIGKIERRLKPAGECGLKRFDSFLAEADMTNRHPLKTIELGAVTG